MSPSTRCDIVHLIKFLSAFVHATRIPRFFLEQFASFTCRNNFNWHMLSVYFYCAMLGSHPLTSKEASTKIQKM